MLYQLIVVADLTYELSLALRSSGLVIVNALPTYLRYIQCKRKAVTISGLKLRHKTGYLPLGYYLCTRYLLPTLHLDLRRYIFFFIHSSTTPRISKPSMLQIIFSLSPVKTYSIYQYDPQPLSCHIHRFEINGLDNHGNMYIHILFFISLSFPITSIGFVIPVAFCTAGSFLGFVSMIGKVLLPILSGEARRLGNSYFQHHEYIVFLAKDVSYDVP